MEVEHEISKGNIDTGTGSFIAVHERYFIRLQNACFLLIVSSSLSTELRKATSDVTQEMIRMIANGTPITTVSSRLGHSSPAITGSIYLHPIPSADEKAAETIESIFHSKDSREA